MAQDSPRGVYGLVADVGGTHARFALCDPAGEPRTLHAPMHLASAQFGSFAEAARAYLSRQKFSGRLAAAVFAIAGPIAKGQGRLTNLGWTLSQSDLGVKLGGVPVRLINDFEALSLSLPVLAATDFRPLGGRTAFDPAGMGAGTLALVGPGTGLGVGGLLRASGLCVPLVAEGGHAGFAPTDETECAVLAFLTRRFGRVSAERVLSGPGLRNLYQALADREETAAEDLAPEEITRRAKADPGSLEARTVSRFCALLGSVCGDIALVMGARQGVVVAGGVVPALGDLFDADLFRARFEAKGRFADYMKASPSALLLHPQAALLGAATQL
jgi:glucokinase